VTTTPANGNDALTRRILWGLLAGVGLGAAARVLVAFGLCKEVALDWLAAEILDPFGLVFLRILFFVVVPLVFVSLTLGLVQLGHLEKLAPMAGRTFLLFLLNMTVASVIGLLVMNILHPGSRIEPETQTKLLHKFGETVQTLQARAAARPSLTLAALVEMFMPQNLLKSVVEFQLLPLILFSLLAGISGGSLPLPMRERLQGGLEIAATLITGIIHLAMRLAPFAVAALVFSAIAKFGWDILRALLLFVPAVIGGMLLHLFGVMSLFLKIWTRRSPVAFFKSIEAVLITAFSTSSSNATLPTTIQIAREKLGISASTAGFVLPLGATMNMSGTALYEGCVVLFIAQVYGIHLGLAQQIVLVVLSVLSSVAVAGIPGGSLPFIVGLLSNFGIPAEGIALILGVDRLLDMCRTVLNVGADIVTACIVDDRFQEPAA